MAINLRLGGVATGKKGPHYWDRSVRNPRRVPEGSIKLLNLRTELLDVIIAVAFAHVFKGIGKLSTERGSVFQNND